MHRRDKQEWTAGNRRQHRRRNGETEKKRRSGLTCTWQEEETHALPHHPSFLLQRRPGGQRAARRSPACQFAESPYTSSDQWRSCQRRPPTRLNGPVCKPSQAKPRRRAPIFCLQLNSCVLDVLACSTHLLDMLATGFYSWLIHEFIYNQSAELDMCLRHITKQYVQNS